MKTFPAVCALCLCSLLFLKGNGQSELVPRYELGLHIGTFIYQGDLTPNDYGAFNTMKPGFTISATRNLNSLYAIRFQLLRGSLKGDDSKYENPDWRQQRNFKFKTPVTELSLQGVRNILSLRSNEAGIINFTPYIFAGISYSFLNIKRDWSNFNYSHFAGEAEVINGLNEDINHPLPKGLFPFRSAAVCGMGSMKNFLFPLKALIGSSAMTTWMVSASRQIPIWLTIIIQ